MTNLMEFINVYEDQIKQSITTSAQDYKNNNTGTILLRKSLGNFAKGNLSKNTAQKSVAQDN